MINKEFSKQNKNGIAMQTSAIHKRFCFFGCHVELHTKTTKTIKIKREMRINVNLYIHIREKQQLTNNKLVSLRQLDVSRRTCSKRRLFSRDSSCLSLESRQ